MRLRPQLRAPIDDRHFDVAIIGGGINGVAIARECARAGRRTLLVEQNDFASGTTSRSTRIIHGGLRYLEHGEIGLVRESLRERQRLLTERPHLVRPMQFVLALGPGGRSAMEVRLGLWLYRKFAGAKPSSGDAVAHLERLLDRDGQALRLFTYDDAQCEFPERLVAEWLRDALESGTVARNHTTALSVEIVSGRVRGLRLRDTLQGNEYAITANHIVNATGPWADAVCRASGVDTAAPMVGGVRGSHIVLPRFEGAPHTALYTEGIDGRPVFLLPWNGLLLFGTTEVNDDGDPGKVRPSDAEVTYLCDSLRRLFPEAPLSEIRYAFAGIRPLPHAPGRNAAAVTRRHFLRDHAEDGAQGLISVIGGKLTTAASLARTCARMLGVNAPEPIAAAVVSTDMEVEIERFIRDVALIGRLDEQHARGLVSRHGAGAVELAHQIANDDRLREPLTDHNNHLLVEATCAVQKESAITLGDILLRRVPIALGPDFSSDDVSGAAKRIGSVFDWSERQIQHELEEFEMERSAFLIRPAVATFA